MKAAPMLMLLAMVGVMAYGSDEHATYTVIRSEKGEGGVLTCRVQSPFQPGTTRVRILAPEKLPPKAKRRVLFVLPVEPAPERRWGDGFETVRKLNVHNRFGFVVVAPSFAQRPWYCDHPTEATKRQEAYMLKVVLPLVTKLYPHRRRRRALLGFSKSGWGAWSLLLRHPDQFGAAAAWDAPMMMAKLLYGMNAIVGTREQFERYRIPHLLEKHADAVRKSKRLALLGHANFRRQHQQCHALMTRLDIPHVYADGPKREHHWDSGWVEAAVEALHRMMPANPGKEN